MYIYITRFSYFLEYTKFTELTCHPSKYGALPLTVGIKSRTIIYTNKMRCEIVALYHFTYLMSNFYSLDKIHYQNRAKTALFSMIYYLRKKFFHIDNCILNSRAAISFSKIQNFSARLLLYCKIKRKLARVTVLRTFPSPYGDLSARYLSYRQVRTTKNAQQFKRA